MATSKNDKSADAPTATTTAAASTKKPESGTQATDKSTGGSATGQTAATKLSPPVQPG